jgi:hypothetical protein
MKNRDQAKKHEVESESNDFNAVEFMRKRREDLSKETEGMTPDQELKFFAEKFVEYERKKKK